MFAYTIRRVLAIIPLVVAVATITFLLMNAVEGGPFDSDRPLSEATRKNLEKKYGLDDPFAVRYVKYIWNLAHGDLGVSLTNDREVRTIITERMQVSIQLGLATFLFATTVGLTLGSLAALNQNGAGDYAGVFVATAGAALPSFVLAPILQIIFSVKLGWFTVLASDYGFTQWFRGDFSNWQQIILPTLSLGFLSMAFVARITRAAMLEVLRQDYIRTAWAKGMRQRQVLLRHAAKNALIPVLTILGPIFAGLVVGSFIVETAFGIPGVGQLFVRSVLIRDYEVIMGVTVFFTVVIAVMNLVVDLLYAVVDPRIRL
ncbi:MAG: ABC transporter permease [Dehalococcoidia bacterium]|nr:ABC transporter permease [Dehalococcoidia bacterium]MCB9485880.1 ABC transporter permease [Thermoflexaceae bacterium]